ncbi:MAG: J domain-containing protein [Bacteroidetes Order II. Incertae sedis bacterium]|jgi:curved DNA-binding protein|nr:J domain-containing protein [Bacteroidetes Order II. bacterium]MBT4052533.1 J domain-containing protein [Bacteroidetes Order II. bacterium]MBT4602774.1 J domain-containing protein [Bacteroidetes Order II. bacterium]MBT5249216.1 J domain-containing protein [Bacteroidetes Order II. bacterium]MBT6199578.1 J domain-containing protein [Bacteroidetes Order II. bacterium]
MNQDLYKILGVAENADAVAIKKSYRRLARELHPDKNQEDPKAEDKFKEVQQAYEVLSDDKKRRQYDRMKRYGGAAGGPFQSRRGGNFHRSDDGTYVRSDGMGGGADPGFSDIFEQFFGGTAGMGGRPTSGRSASRGAQQPRSTEAYDRKRTVRISMSRMLKGGNISFTLDGEKIQIPFPKGVKDGHKVRVKGKGRQMPNGQYGHLYVTIRVDEQENLWREASTLHKNVEISVFDALLGADLTIKTPLDTSLKLKIPAGSQYGAKLRIRGHGVETDKAKGDLIVHLNFSVPEALSEEQKDLLKQARDAE